MRLFKFKAWDKEKKRMSLPFYLGDDVIKWSDGDIDMPIAFAASKTATRGRMIWLQFTGLYDKNEKEIWEGDIVRWLGWEVRAGQQIRRERVLVIGRDEGWITDCFHIQNIAQGNSRMTQEVIGNIYENSDIISPKPR